MGVKSNYVYFDILKTCFGNVKTADESAVFTW